MPTSRLTLRVAEAWDAILKPSPALTRHARRLRSNIKKPVAFNPQTGRFYTAEEYASEKATIDQDHLRWLLDLGQREDDSFKPADEVMLSSFVGLYGATPEAKTPPDMLRKLAAEVRVKMIEKGTWEFQLQDTERVVQWSGAYAIGHFKTSDWQTAFRLRAAELVTEYAEQVRKCARAECGRLFVAVKRQAYCSTRCSQSARFARYWKRLPKKERRQKRHQQYVKQVRKERGSAVANQVGSREPKGE